MKIGDYARSVETGWVGRIVSHDRGQLRLHGVDFYAVMIGGDTLANSVDSSDCRWYDADDLIRMNHQAGCMVA